jgi:hypothetical protein
LRFPAELEAAVMKGLERDLGRRWKTVQEFADALVGAAAGAEVEESRWGGGLFSRIFGKRE